MLTDLTKIDWEGIIKQEAPAVKEDVLKTASERNGHEKPGARLAYFCTMGVECAKAGKRTLLISLDYPVGVVMRKLFSICLNEPFPPGSKATPEKIEAVRNVVGDRILIFTPDKELTYVFLEELPKFVPELGTMGWKLKRETDFDRIIYRLEENFEPEAEREQRHRNNAPHDNGDYFTGIGLGHGDD